MRRTRACANQKIQLPQPCDTLEGIQRFSRITRFHDRLRITASNDLFRTPVERALCLRRSQSATIGATAQQIPEEYTREAEVQLPTADASKTSQRSQHDGGSWWSTGLRTGHRGGAQQKQPPQKITRAIALQRCNSALVHTALRAGRSAYLQRHPFASG